ncbi:MAG: hypothetical protein ABIL46_01135 [candidate division WOR-3 bacterium]
MKNILLIAIILFNLGFSGKKHMNIEVVPKEKQDEVLIKGPVEKGGYGGLVIKFTELNDDFACLIGGRGGIILNHTFSVGGGIYGLANRIDVHTNYPLRDYIMDFSYGGLILELIFGSRRLVHFGISSLIGGGCISYRTPFYEPWYDDGFFVFEPSAEITLNVTKCFRIDIGSSYRYIYGTDLNGVSDNSLSGAAGHITFKFGKF